MGQPDTRATLILRIRDTGDEEAWNEFVEIYTPLIFNFAVSRGLQPADARDVLQIVLHNIFRAIPKFHYDPKKGTFRSWLYTIVRHEVFRHLRTSGRQPQSSDPSELKHNGELTDDPEAKRWEFDYRLRLFQWASDKVEPEFTPRNWQAFYRTAVKEEDPAEVAKDLGMSRAAVYVSRSRVLSRLREKVANVADQDWAPGLEKRN
ncbi:MAG: sigma-70 family RNA polymerase sigma factor [Verrucomicrobiota bacterium JB023]|nr:sigma-70 family RNA polymerase sigma factor [Verrucomicrobiota bacterium JB023]